MPVGQSAFDFRLTIDGVTYGLHLAEDANGVRQWNDGLTPMLAPQFRTNNFGYDHVPPEIEVASVAEDWTEGAGFRHLIGTQAVRMLRYEYSRGLDLSYADRVFISPQEQTGLVGSSYAAISAAPSGFLYSPSLGFFMRAGAYIYEWDVTASPARWEQRDDATGTFSGASFTDFTELDGVLYAPRGTSADYKYSTDGVTWTAFTDADENADFMAVRGNGSDIASLWKTNDNLIKASVNGANGGTAWAGADEIGHTSETPTGIVVSNNSIFLFKREGIYLYDTVNTQDVWKTQEILDNNGRNPYVWSNGLVYVPYGRRLIEFDPSNLTLSPVFPTENMDSLEIMGDITAVGGDLFWLYCAVKNRAGDTYIMKGKPGQGWHTFLYLGANDCNILAVVPGGVLHSANPCLVYGKGTASNYVILPRGQILPSDDPNYQFSLTEGVLYGTNMDFGAKTYDKLLNHAMILGEGLSAGRPATLKYTTDETATETTLVEATAPGLTKIDTSSEVAFNKIKYVLYMSTGDETVSPTVDSLTLWATLNPPRKRMWKPVVILDDDRSLRGGVTGRMSPSSVKLREVLFAATDKRITLVDRENYSYAVRLLDVNSVATVYRTIGGKRFSAKGYQLTLVELATLTNNSTDGVYGQSTYGGGHVFA